MASENHQLSAEDLREIEECEKIVEFADEVVAGRHPRIKILPHVFPQPQPHLQTQSAQEATPRPPSYRSDKIIVIYCGVEAEIDISVDYYKILGVEPHVSTDSIIRGFKFKSTIYGPQVKRKWFHSNDNVRNEIRDKWARVSKAHEILTDPELRKIYDSRRADFLSASTSDSTAHQLEDCILTDEQKEVLKRKMKREVEMGERKNCRGEKEEVWEREERLGGMESDADDGDSTKAVYHSRRDVTAYSEVSI